jgi:5-methylcytosine-specific restriction endonuclease McrA
MHINKHQVLVLNKLWQAVNVVCLQEALSKVFSTYKDGTPKARIIGSNDGKSVIIDPTEGFQTFTWEDWSQLRCDPDEDFIRSVNWKFKIPQVILLSDYGDLPQRKVKFSRRMVHRSDNYQCQYCGCTPGAEDLTIDHILPRFQGGKTTWENCCTCCFKCNQKKNDRTPEQAGMKLLRQPKKPKFNLFKTERKFVPKTWRHFIDHLVSESFWDVELENDN